jgi:hypothetical protein
MPTAAELAARTDCADLEKRLDAQDTVIKSLNERIMRLNGLLVARDQKIDYLTAANEQLEAALVELRAGRQVLTF